MRAFNFGVNTASDSFGTWRELAIFSAYRLFLSLIFFCVFYFNLPPYFLGRLSPSLYESVSILYLLIALVFVAVNYNRVGDFKLNAQIQLIVDVICLTLVINSSGGLQSGLGLLLVVVVAAGAALIPGRLSAFTAAIATIAVLSEVGYSQFIGDGLTKYSHAGLLGITFFATAIFAQIISQKMKKSQNLADERARDVAKLAILNGHILSSMQTGILVVDSDDRVTLSNQSARHLLKVQQAQENSELSYFSSKLVEKISQWRVNNNCTVSPFQSQPDSPEVVARFIALDSGETLIYLDNTTALAQQVQQLKLASLGRLTASIAHEIRNPLGAISHAGELLSETHNDDAVTTKLTTIIQRNSVRVNGIIEAILDMSRRKAVEPKRISLALWLNEFITEFCEIKQLNKTEFKLSIRSSQETVNIDEEQLHQIMSNLLENAWFYSSLDRDESRVQIILASKNDDVIIDVKDNGIGVVDEMKENLFEPFHSNRQGGTGLGLYLTRELCQANGAQLRYIATEKDHCFRVSFPIEKQEIS